MVQSVRVRETLFQNWVEKVSGWYSDLFPGEVLVLARASFSYKLTLHACISFVHMINPWLIDWLIFMSNYFAVKLIVPGCIASRACITACYSFCSSCVYMKALGIKKKKKKAAANIKQSEPSSSCMHQSQQEDHKSSANLKALFHTF